MGVVGKPTPVTINSGIYLHEDDRDDIDKDIIIIHGSSDHPISLQDVFDAYMYMEQQLDMLEFPKCYLGIEYNKESDIYEIFWG